jgi:hypothetical protein
MELRMHPHSGAGYKVVQQNDTTFGVEVIIPGTHPITVTSFPTEAEADRWIAKHRQEVAMANSLRQCTLL